MKTPKAFNLMPEFNKDQKFKSRNIKILYLTGVINEEERFASLRSDRKNVLNLFSHAYLFFHLFIVHLFQSKLLYWLPHFSYNKLILDCDFFYFYFSIIRLLPWCIFTIIFVASSLTLPRQNLTIYCYLFFFMALLSMFMV